nr:hypothetical protein [Tanacetum cinerariifolium]
NASYIVRFTKEREGPQAGFWWIDQSSRAGGIYPGTLPLDRVEVLGSDDGVTTSFQRSQNSRPPMLDHQDKFMMKAQASGVVKPKIRGNVNFEIKSQFMRELREDIFSGNKNNDAYEHVEWILDIVSLFNILGVTYDAVMLRVFPITPTGAAKRWVDKLSPETINT